MKWPITYCPVCGAEHTGTEKLTELEAVKMCIFLEFEAPPAIQHNQWLRDNPETAAEEILSRLEQSEREFVDRVREMLGPDYPNPFDDPLFLDGDDDGSGLEPRQR
jgi:hypothetical protein